MNTSLEQTQPPSAGGKRRNMKWLYWGGSVCVLAWLALGAGIALGVDRGPLIVLTTLAALTSEGMIWLTALVLGINVYTARRQLWRKLRERLG